MAALPAIGLAQLALGVSPAASYTVEAVLHWASLAAVFTLARHACSSREDRTAFLGSTAAFGAAMSVVCLIQASTARGIFGAFRSYNNWAQFAELMIPLAIWKIADSRAKGPFWACSAGLLIASVVAAGARAGTILCTIVAVAALLALARSSPVPRHKLAVPLLLAPVAAIAFTVIAGTDLVWKRLHQDAPYQDRMQYLLSSLDLIGERPVLGWGLGTWPLVYPHKARQDDFVFVNRAHNDWAEYTSDGGFVFLIALAAPFLAAIPWMWRHPWSLGIVAVLAHAAVDYPFPRPGVSGWLFALLGALYAARGGEPCDDDLSESSERKP